jgi:pimeloyl-ACP methyl ester carboxylesterase
MRNRLLWLALLAIFVVGCGGGDLPVTATTRPAPTVAGPGVSIRILDTDTGFQARSQAGVDLFRVTNSSGKSVQVHRDPSAFDHTLRLVDLTETSDTFIVEMLDANGGVFAHYQFTTSIPGEVIVHADRFTPGTPKGLRGIGEFIEQYQVPVFGPSLTETYWKAAVDVPPPFTRSEYDIIGLHRIAGDNPRPGRVLLFLPGAQCNGNLYTPDETRDFRLWLANRGYEVYSLDYRVHFAPPFNIMGVSIPGLVAPDLRFMAPWNGAAYIMDVRTAIDFIKANSGVDKVFLGGFSSGCQVAYYYACSDQGGRLGQEDLRGLFALDGGPWQQGCGEPLESITVAETSRLIREGPTDANIRRCKQLSADPLIPGYYSVTFGSLTGPPFPENLLAWLADPNAPSPSNPGETAEQFIVDRFWHNWGTDPPTDPNGDGQFTNIGKGYNTLPTLLAWCVLAADNYWPLAFSLDDATVTNYAGPPDGPYKVPVNAGGLHYLDTLQQINIPQFCVASGAWVSFNNAKPAWRFQGIELSSSNRADTRQATATHLGHLDLLSGTLSNEWVARPLLEWLDQY